MSDVWSRAWCETQKIPNFAVKGKNFYYLVSNLNSILLAGITPSNEVRDAPNYLRPISSEPTEHDSTCELSRSPSPDMSGILCYKLRSRKEREKYKTSTNQPSMLTSCDKTYIWGEDSKL